VSRAHNEPLAPARGLQGLINRLFKLELMNGDGLCPIYLHRWTLLRALGCGLYVHKFVGDDWSLDMHDHPKRFISIGLWGQYTEQYVVPQRWGTQIQQRVYRAPWLRTFPATHIHRITGPTPEKPCWTLVLVLRASRPWGFWTNRWTWIPWKKYVGSDRAKQAKSCP
jgi:hypothetical protein